MSERRRPDAQGALSFERRVFQVGELTRAVRGLLEETYGNVWVEGELSNFKAYTSGHWYFTLKDDTAQLRGVMFRGNNARVRFRPEDGMALLCRGRITVYEARGDYQLLVEELEPRGAGALQVAFEQLKARLEAEGLFRAERKRPLPLRPVRVGIVTSPTGAAIRDLLQVMERRDPTMPVLLCPTRVQGEGAGAEVAEAIERLGGSGLVDVVIAGRGGGSIEDLWAFNEEVVARAIAACPVPVVSAVGHEVDFTIADFVADLRAPTPSAAAELVVPERARLQLQLTQLRERGRRAVLRQLAEGRHALRASRQSLGDPRHLVARQRMGLDELAYRAESALRERLARERRRLGVQSVGLRQRHPTARLHRDRARLAEAAQRLGTLVRQRVEGDGRRFAVLLGKLHALSPLGILGRGYAIARHPDGRVVSRTRHANPGDALELLLADGRLQVRVEGVPGRDEAPRLDDTLTPQGPLAGHVATATPQSTTRDAVDATPQPRRRPSRARATRALTPGHHGGPPLAALRLADAEATAPRDATPADHEAALETLRRQSGLRLDRDGRFWHEGTPIEHPRLHAVLSAGLERHPEGGEYIVRVGREWAYVEVEDAPLVVLGLDEAEGLTWLRLSDGTREPLDAERLWLDASDVPYARVRGGSMTARFSRVAFQSLAPHLELDDEGVARLWLGGRAHVLPRASEHTR